MRDKHNNALAIGDEVYCYIPGSPGCYGVVIGVMTFASKAEDVVCIAGEEYTGMPVNTVHLERTTDVSSELAAKLRANYLAKFPGTLKEI